MKLLFTYNNTLGSRIIRAVSGQPVSHVAVEIIPGTISHMTFSGFKQEPYTTFIQHQRIAKSIFVATPNPFADIERLEVYRNKKHPYDYFAFMWLAALLCRRRLFGTPIIRNHWQKTWMEICTEFAQHMLGQHPDGALTAGDLLEKMEKAYVQL